MAEKYTEKKKESNKRWDDKNLDRMSLALPAGTKDQIKEHITKTEDSSVNSFIKRAITETMQRDNSL